MSASDDLTKAAQALIDRALVLEEIVRRCTYRDGDGHIRGRRIEDYRMETIMNDDLYRVLDQCHPPLEDDTDVECSLGVDCDDTLCDHHEDDTDD